MRKSAVVKRSIVISGRRTSVSLENAFWNGLKEIAAQRDSTLSGLVTKIGMQHQHGNLSSALRLFILDHFRTLALRDHAQAVVSQPVGDRVDDPGVSTA
jgi:predicted DNA-binding ribbon-helix-helix protein